MDIRCTCTYNITSICRHKATALFYLHNLLEKNELKIKYSEHDTMHTNINIEELNLNLIKQYCSPKTFYLAEEILKKNRPHILSEFDDNVNAEFIYNDETFNLKIKRVENKNYATSCNCRSEKNHPLCLHKVILLMQLYYNYGINYFDTIKNWDIEKNKLLSKYGYT
ncbi:MAG: helicase SNF2, partial [Sediminibacterium sp.]|nr:helicase SNF2 [Sediminibacterium sp.]